MGGRHHYRDAVAPSLRRVAAPAQLLVTPKEARQHLRIDHNDDDASLEVYLRAATEMLDGVEGRLGRALVSQEWEQRQAKPDRHRVDILLGPNPQIVSLFYVDTADNIQALTVSDFRVIDMGDRAYIEPRPGYSWPTDFADRPDALRIVFAAGEAAEDIAETIKQAIRLIAGHWYEQREATAVVEMREIPIGAETLINISKVHGWVG